MCMESGTLVFFVYGYLIAFGSISQTSRCTENVIRASKKKIKSLMALFCSLRGNDTIERSIANIVEDVIHP